MYLHVHVHVQIYKNARGKTVDINSSAAVAMTSEPERATAVCWGPFFFPLNLVLISANVQVGS